MASAAWDRLASANFASPRHVLVLGPAGCGKSALINGLAGGSVIFHVNESPAPSFKLQQKLIELDDAFKVLVSEASGLSVSSVHVLHEALLKAQAVDVVLVVHNTGHNLGDHLSRSSLFQALDECLGRDLWQKVIFVLNGCQEGDFAVEEKRVLRDVERFGVTSKVFCWEEGSMEKSSVILEAMGETVNATMPFYPRGGKGKKQVGVEESAADVFRSEFADLEIISDCNIAQAEAIFGGKDFEEEVESSFLPPSNISGEIAKMESVVVHREDHIQPRSAEIPAFGSLSLALSASVISGSSLLPVPSFSLKRVETAVPRGTVSSSGRLNVKNEKKPSTSSASSLRIKSVGPTALLPEMTGRNFPVGLKVGIPSLPAVKMSRASFASRTSFPEFSKLPELGKGFGAPNGAAGLRVAGIVWFRNDLRLHDNEALSKAHNECSSILPVFCFDPRDYGKSSSGFDKTGPYRAKFLLDCVADLRKNLRERGSDLFVRIGLPEVVLPQLAKAVGAEKVFSHMEVTAEEAESEIKVEAKLKEVGVEMSKSWGSTLYHLEDLPFSLPDMPSNYGGFRVAVKNLKVRDVVEAPEQLKGTPLRGNLKPGDIPSLQDLGLNTSSSSSPLESGKLSRAPPSATSSLVGGEREALQRLRTFVAEANSKKRTTADAAPSSSGESLYGANFSCKISPWLAMGCLSPRHMFFDIRNATSNQRGTNTLSTSTMGLDWLIFELLWRDFFRFITKKYSISKTAVVDQTASSAIAS